MNKLHTGGPTTDKELSDNLRKENFELSKNELNKTLLDLEIKGLIVTKWVGRDKKRIELVNLEKKAEVNGGRHKGDNKFKDNIT
jgi:DNA-binding PadR family transcriptional regulator